MNAAEDCDACDNLQQLSAMTGGSVFAQLKQHGNINNEGTNQGNTSSKVVDKQSLDVDVGGRPINFEELGNSTWNLIHTMAAYYPEKPTEERKKATEQFIDSLGEVYPCNYCATSWKDELKEVPIKVDNRKEFSQWACEIHNVINDKLGKDIFDCNQVDKRWRFDPSEREKLYE